MALLIAVPLIWSLFTWLLMLFLGNLGLEVSFWGALPGAVLLSMVGSSSNSQKI